MSTVKWLVFVALTVYPDVALGYEARETETTVEVVDETGEPIQGANVVVTYSPLRGDDYRTGRGISDAEGMYRFKDAAYYEIFVSAEKGGFYKAKAELRAFERDEEERIVPLDPSITLVLKKVINPVPMYAQHRLTVVVPEFNVPLEFDLFRRDWLPPHGEGEHADVVFEVNGYHNSWTDRDTSLVATFPNEGDGLIEIEGGYQYGSELLSPQVAPELGYSPRFEHRKAVRTEEKQNSPVGPSYIRVGMDDEPMHFVFRIRTRYDQAGEIEEAYYGKLYRAFQFDGVWDKESVIIFGDYYLNPTSNSRKLEYKIGLSLIDGLSGFDEPQKP